jgi:hypothetical protein
MPTKQSTNSEEEVDLGSLFVIIGKGFSKFLILLGTFLKEFFISLS